MRQSAVREDTRESILDASRHLLIRYGYRKMTMDDLAREAGIGKGTIYLYFRSKEDVALSCADRLTVEVQEQLREVAAGAESAAERLHRMLVMRVLLRLDHAQPYAGSLDDMFVSLRSALLKRRELWLESEAEIFAEVLADGNARGEFEVPDVKSAAVAMLLATNALMPFSLSPKELGARDEVERKVSRIADLLLHGVLRKAPAAANPEHRPRH